MKFFPGAFQSPPSLRQPPLTAVRSGFLAHKYLMVAILTCLQERHPRRQAPPLAMRNDPAVHRWMREPSAVRQITPCVVVREHQDRGDLSVIQLPLDDIDLQTQPLSGWMRAVAPSSSEPDRDTVHLAIAPTLPGVPMLVHSIGAGGEAFTHTCSDGTWSHSSDDEFLLRVIRHAQLVATVSPLNSEPTGKDLDRPAVPPDTAPADQGLQPCDLVALGLRYDHIAVHAAIKELGEHRRSLRRVRAAPPAGLLASDR